MEDYLLFRKRSPLSEEGLGFISGCEEHTHIAKRNTTGRACASAILVRSLVACLEGKVREASSGTIQGYAQLDALVQSSSTPGKIHACSVREGFTYLIPNGDTNNATYHIGILALLQALLAPECSQDLIASYRGLLSRFLTLGRSREIKSSLLHTADELYYWLRYRGADPEKENDKMSCIQIGNNQDHPLIIDRRSLDIAYLFDADTLDTLIRKRPAVKPTRHPKSKPTPVDPRESGFIGNQLMLLKKALQNEEDVLLAGYTGTGKTMCVQQATLALQTKLVIVEGKEGMIDLDFLGSYLPQPDGNRCWKDGPIVRAIRMAKSEPVILFLDELNRFPRAQINILIGLMNRVPGRVCQQMGLDTHILEDSFVMEIPMTSEIVYCPASRLRFVAAGNFGKSFAVYDLDPALRRRFTTVIDFEFLPPKVEGTLVSRLHPGLPQNVVNSLVKLAIETRRMLDNGELPGCIDTASLMNWAGKCERASAHSAQTVMECARHTWADQVCGRNHLGMINTGSFHALEDYLQALGTLAREDPKITVQELPFEEFMKGSL
jgi:MoxR-like ATPase